MTMDLILAQILDLLMSHVSTMNTKQCTMLIMALESAGMGSQAVSALQTMKALDMPLNKVSLMTMRLVLWAQSSIVNPKACGLCLHR